MSAQNKPKRKKISFGSMVVKTLLALPVCIVMLPTIVFLAAAMLPSFVLLVWKPREIYRWLSVLSLNVAGAMPYLFDLWLGLHRMDTTFIILSNPAALIVIYSAAAGGWLLYSAVPPLVAVFVRIVAFRQVERLKAERDALVARWGEDVAA